MLCVKTEATGELWAGREWRLENHFYLRGGHTAGDGGAVTMSVCRRSGGGMDQGGVRTAQGANVEPAGAAPLWV